MNRLGSLAGGIKHGGHMAPGKVNAQWVGALYGVCISRTHR